MDLVEQYEIRRKAFDLHTVGRNDLAEQQLLKVLWIENCSIVADQYFGALFDLTTALLRPAIIHRQKNLIRFLQAIRNKRGLEDAKCFLRTQFGDHLEKYLRSLNTFFSCFNEIGMIIYYVRCGIEPPPSMASASPGFDNIEKLYGDAFETIMDFAIIPAVLNNVSDGRPYDKFKSMDIAKYLILDKARKMWCFQDNPRLSHLTEMVDSQRAYSRVGGDL